MDTRITAHELEANLLGILDRIHDKGEQFLIERDGAPVATLAPAKVSTVTFQGLVASLGDLRLPGDGFADDLEMIQNSQSPATVPPWPS